MKNLVIFFIAIVFLSTINVVKAQYQYTIYDDLPGMIKSYKPSYQDSFPDWAKMLYQEPINYFEVEESFKEWSKDNKVEKTAVLRYYKLWKRVVADFVIEDGSIEIPDLKLYEKNLRQSQLNYASRPTKSNDNWSFLGPKETFWLNESGSSTPPSSCPWQVNVYSFDVAPSDPNVIYAGTETSLVNKSVDNGLSWEQLGLNYPFGGGVTATVIHPTNPDIVYVSAGNQIHKTTDGGLSWEPMLESGSQFQADKLVIDPNNPDKIVAAASNGIQVSEDGGVNWDRNWNIRCWDIVIQSGNSNRIFGITKSAANFALVESNDGGNSFMTDTGFPTDIIEASGGLLAVTNANPNKIIAVMLSANNTPYLYVGNLSNGNWSLLAEGNTNQLPMNNGQGFFDLALEISPIDADLIFVGTTTLYKSSDGGNQFFAIGGYSGPFSIHPDIQDLKILNNGNMWVATDGGLSWSTDHFTSTNNYFSRNNGLVGSDMWGFHQGWNEDIIVGGRYHNGNTALADFYGEKALRMGGAESPTGWIIPGKSRHAAFNDLGNGWILPSSAEGQPEGRFIFSKYPNMEEYGGRRGNMVFHPNYYGTIYLGEGDAVWRSMDRGESFEMLHDFGSQTRYLDISFSNPNVLYIDIVNQGLFKSEDGGLSWIAKPSLTSGVYGNYNWEGKTQFVISPTDENTVYACLSNGTWSADIGKIFKSEDGGDSWENYTADLDEYTKCIVIQPDENGEDILYLFTNNKNGKSAKVFMRTEADNDWQEYSTAYPAGMSVNYAMPFFRDGKLRVAGTAAVWESPLEVEDMAALVQPWAEKSFYDCMFDTVFLNDHSIMNHEGASWFWEITPEPVYMEDASIRNPKVVLGNPGFYTVKLTITKDGTEYSREIVDMLETTTCPSIYDCDNPAEVPKDIWNLVYVDSEEVNYPGLATMSFDDDASTIWHTRWSTGSDPYPHEIQVDMGDLYLVSEFTVLNRQDGQNGRIKDYELYISDDTENWGLPVAVGEWQNTAAPQTIELDSPMEGQYFRLVALSEVNGNEWASAAEFSIVGCIDATGLEKISWDLKAFPIPTHDEVSIPLPAGSSFSYRIFSVNGQLIEEGQVTSNQSHTNFDLRAYNDGFYIVQLISTEGTYYYVKVLKE